MHPVIILSRVSDQNWLWVVVVAGEMVQLVYVPLWTLMPRLKPLRKCGELVLHMPVRVMMMI